MLENYSNLPGMLVEFTDGGMSLREDIGVTSTESMLILGTAIDGPVLEPVAVSDQTAEVLFGKAVQSNGASNGSTLIKAYKQARKRGCNDIRLMRVTGSTAKATLEGSETTVTETKRITENFTTVSGNDNTSIKLANTYITKDSVKVYVKGIQLLTGYTVEYEAGIVTISAGVCDAGVPVSIQYTYNKPVKVTNEVTTVSKSGTKISATLSYETTVEGMSISFNDAVIDSNTYSVSGKVITFTSNSGLSSGDSIKVSYTHHSGDVVSVTENGTGSEPFVTGTSTISHTIENEYKAGTLKLYVDDVLYSPQSVLTIDGNIVTVDKKYFTKGSVLTLEYVKESVKVNKSEVVLDSYFGGSVYNQGNVKVVDEVNGEGDIVGKSVIITKPESKKNSSLETPLTYSSNDYPTIQMLIEAINNDSNNGIYKASSAAEDMLTKELKTTNCYFVGGDDGINVSKQELFQALSGIRDENGYLIKSGAYQLLEDYQTDWIVPVGVYADEVLDGKNESFAYELALLCAVLSYRNKTTLGAIAMKPNTDTSLAGVQEYVKDVCAFNNLFYMKDENGSVILDSDGNPMDLGKFISVVAGPEIKVTDSSAGIYYGNPAIDYVALNSTLLPQSAPTNKTIVGASKLKFSFSNAQLDSITGNRIVTFKSRTDKNKKTSIVAIDGVTSANPNSDYTRVTTPKVLRSTVDNIREVCEPFIGEPAVVEQRNAMSAAISKRLSLLKEKGVILDSSFQLLVTAQDQILGSARLELTIVPPQELRKITTVVGLSATI